MSVSPHIKASKIKGKESTQSMSKVTHHAGVYPSFNSMKWLAVSLLPPGWDSTPLQGYSIVQN